MVKWCASKPNYHAKHDVEGSTNQRATFGAQTGSEVLIAGPNGIKVHISFTYQVSHVLSHKITMCV